MIVSTGTTGVDATPFLPQGLTPQLHSALPLLNALVEASDFHFELAELRGSAARAEADQGRVEYRIVVKSAIDQARPSKTLLWHREKLVVVFARQHELPFDSR